MLLAYLAAHLGKAVPRDRLKALLWSDRSEQQASGSLRRSLSDLRKVLSSVSDEPVLESNSATVTLLEAYVDVDVARFERLFDKETEAAWAEAAELYQGDLLADISAQDPAFEDWLRIERERLRTMAVNFAEKTVVRSQSAETVEAIAGLARRMLRADPAAEEAHRTLIIALRREGRQNAAIKQFAACVEAMRTALRAEPEERTKALLDAPLADLGGAFDVRDEDLPPPQADAASDADAATAATEPQAILSADAVGFDATARQDLAELNGRHHAAAFDLVEEHDGTLLRDGEGLLQASFASPVQAVLTAIAIQLAVNRRNADLTPDERAGFRIGVTMANSAMGQNATEGERLREIAGPEGICVTGEVRNRIAGSTCCGIDGFAAEPVAEPSASNAYRIEWRDRGNASGFAPDRTPVLPSQPSIAVMPFANFSEDPAHAFLADALAEDIITALSRYRWFFVIARNSSFTYKDRSFTAQQVARDLGVRYILEGSVRRIGERIRVTGQLIDAQSGRHLWAEHYDRDLTDIFAIQDELTQNIVGALEPEMLVGETIRAKSKAPEHLDAYEYCMRGLWHHHQGTGENLTRAIDWYKRAIAVDPDYARAHASKARSHFVRCFLGTSEDVNRERAELAKAAERAAVLDEREPYAHFAMFLAHLVHGCHHSARAEAQRVIDLNPNCALGYLGYGQVRNMLGQFARALEPLRTALRLSPRDQSECYFLGHMADAHYQLGDYQNAMQCARRALAVRRIDFLVAILAASLGQLGRGDEARRLRAEITIFDPAQSVRYREVIFGYADPSCYDHLLKGLEKAGLKA